MGVFRGVSEGFRLLRRGRSILRTPLTAAAAFFYSAGGSAGAERRILYCAIRRIFDVDGKLHPELEKSFRRLLDETAPDVNSEQEWREVNEMTPCDCERLICGFRTMEPGAAHDSMKFLLALLYHSGAGEDRKTALQDLAGHIGMAEKEFAEMESDIRNDVEVRKKMLSSGAGIAAALIVLLVFILTATLLRSVIFGLIAAYLFLPLERYFESNLRARRGPGHWLSLTGKIFSWLPGVISETFRRREAAEEISPELQRKKQEQKIISKAVAQTVLAFILLAGIFIGGTYMLSVHYLQGISAKIRSIELQRKNGETDVDTGLARFKARIKKIPGAEFLVKRAGAVLKDEKSRQELLNVIVRRSGGVFSFLFGVLGTVAALAADLLLTIFFAMLFLMKMAEFQHRSGSSKGSDYVVRTILKSNWLPNVSEGTLLEARRIVSGMFERIRIWLKGYITLVLVDSTVYTILFGILGVPYFPILGVLAGCGILLPYVGPILSCALTIVVTWLFGDATMTQIGLLLCCYLIYNGIIEQFILYPAVIGESLGLTTLETIIVVLLGAIFAGVAGMILALPAASVIKYLVPQIYRCWGEKRQDAA